MNRKYEEFIHEKLLYAFLSELASLANMLMVGSWVHFIWLACGFIFVPALMVGLCLLSAPLHIIFFVQNQMF